MLKKADCRSVRKNRAVRKSERANARNGDGEMEVGSATPVCAAAGIGGSEDL